MRLRHFACCLGISLFASMVSTPLLGQNTISPEKQREWKRLFADAVEKSTKQFDGKPNLMHYCEPQFGACQDAVVYLNDKGAGISLQEFTNSNGKIILHSICKFNDNRDVRTCNNWDTGQVGPKEMKDKDGKWQAIPSAIIPQSNQLSNNDKSIQYDLRERCGKRGEERFYKDHPELISNPSHGAPSIRHEYRSHYDDNSNKCYYFSSTTVITTDVFINQEIYEINENKNIGFYNKTGNSKTPSMCMHDQILCMTDDEWRSIVKKYMSD